MIFITYLQEKVIIVTGSGRGIGYAIAKYCLDEGATVVIVDSVMERVDKALSRLQDNSGRILGIHETVATREGAKRIISETINRFGKIDALINNAAKTEDNLLLNMEESEFNNVIDTNLKGPFFCTKEVLPSMVQQGNGRIINMIAASGLAGNPGQTNYAASKGGLLSMTLTWSKELRNKNIQVNAVIPTAWTEMSEEIPEKVLLKVMGEEKLDELKSRTPNQVAPLIGYLLSDEGVGVTGQCFGIAGKQLSVWDYAKPAEVFSTEEDRWEFEEIAQLVEGNKEKFRVKPVSPFL
ncbi:MULTISPECIES: SDR family NAD(P)-dependent oxidoreductase [Bacillaceae]|uniref:SDR family oxidoreductase n=1 Tax=Evansella alkalicola TaxID=745819 RepID=A0ABS6K166_9BACI|nr:SDR family NAD(P)-dependent oxidoreductase [Litchfieldia alkalitelluris]MBU9723192.1 SDR family oxidoreductase [Bacillus alkalicola]